MAAATRGFSPEALYVADVTRSARQGLHESAAVGFHQLMHGELAEVWEECSRADWDGYGALPVSRDALRNMYTFLEALPLGFPRPTIGADPNGTMSVEWYRSPRRVLSVAVSDDDLLHYAALLGASSISGTEPFYGEVPNSLLELVRRVYS